MTPLLKVRDLIVRFHSRGEHMEAVSGLSFAIDQGETVAIVGESGCGKSVTAQAIMRLLPPTAAEVSGDIIFEGKNLNACTEKEMQIIRGNNIGMIFQDPMTSLNPTMTIGKQIMEGIRRHRRNLTKHQAKETVKDLLDLVGIADPVQRFDYYPHQFSGGMRQRVMIAIALACDPKLLIADEPTTSLDVTIQAQILELLKDIQRKRNTSILLITHDLGVVAGNCDRIVVMKNGLAVETGAVDQIFYHPAHPYTRHLLDMKKAHTL